VASSFLKKFMQNRKYILFGLCGLLSVGALLWFLQVHAQENKQTDLSTSSLAVVPQSSVEWKKPEFLPAGCTSEIVTDKATGKIIYQKNSNAVWPVASLTKTVSAFALQKSGVDWEKIIVAKDSDLDLIKQNTAPGDSVGNLRVVAGAKIRAKDLLYASLIGSANNSAVALARLVSPDYHGLVERMNEIVQKKKLIKTYFVEPSGIDLKNVSTAKEFSILWRNVVNNPLLGAVIKTPSYSFSIEPEQGVPEEHTVRHTNKIMRYNKRMLAGKTGYLDESGFNLAFWYKNRKGAQRLGVVLGCGTNKWLERRVSFLMEK